MDVFLREYGEAEALALALEKHAHVVATDDRNAMQACKLLRLRFTTAIGSLIDVTAADEARRYLERLALDGRYHRMILEDARRRPERVAIAYTVAFRHSTGYETILSRSS